MVELGIGATTLANNLFAKFFPATAGAPGAAKQPDGSTSFDLRSMVDWRHAAKQGEAARSSRAVTEHASVSTDPGMAAALPLTSLPPALLAKLFEVKAQLSTEEQSTLMQMLSALPPGEVTLISAQLEPMTTDAIVAMIRRELAVPGKEA